jgi:hypothetical protein
MTEVHGKRILQEDEQNKIMQSDINSHRIIGCNNNFSIVKSLHPNDDEVVTNDNHDTRTTPFD